MTTRAFRPTATQRRILQAAMDLLPLRGWPSQAHLATALGVSRQAISQQFANKAFEAWFTRELEAFQRPARVRARAVLAHLAMAGSVEAFKALGWDRLPAQTAAPRRISNAP